MKKKKLIVKPKKKKRLIVKVKKKKTLKEKPSKALKKRVTIPRYKIDLRTVDDKLIEGILELDKIIDKGITILVRHHPAYVIDHLLSQTYAKDIKSGGVRIFSGSRKKEKIKLKILDLISYTHDPIAFIIQMNKLGLIRSVKESVAAQFIDNFSQDPIVLLKHYGDPFPAYKKLFPIYMAYYQLKSHIVKITFATLSRIVLSKYKGWRFKRVITSPGDFLNYEEDVQNSTFSIRKALGMFDPSKTKSFFSYATGWIKEGITSAPFSIDDSNLKIENESGEIVDVRFEPVDDTDNTAYMDKKVFASYVESLWQEPDIEVNEIKILDYFGGSFPIPNELRILYRLLNLKNVNSCSNEDA